MRKIKQTAATQQTTTQRPSPTKLHSPSPHATPHDAISSDLHYVKGKEGGTAPALLKRYTYKITDQIKRTITGTVDNDPVAKQYIPQDQELKILPEENHDPIGDDRHSPVKGIVHRYPDRVLIKLSNVCAVYCRYCFRREMVGPGEGVLTPGELSDALDYIRANTEIWEVILTGGDPLMVSPRMLQQIMDALEDIQHVQVIRIHSRIPIAAPNKITDALCAALTRQKVVYMAVHINHANEITPEVELALSKLHKAGCVLLSQSVLLKGVNDSAETLETLFRKLITLRVKPYYLHHPDFAPGTSHFRLSIKEGQAIMRKLLGRVSGICQPHYMLDIPGGDGKVPINPCYIEALKDGTTYSIEDYKGRNHLYPPQTTDKDAQT